MSGGRPRVALTRWEAFAGGSIGDYRRRLREAGLQPLDYHEPGRSLEDCAGLVLTGGIDVDRALYGARRDSRTEVPKPARDAFELALLEEALRLDLPVLAICRGHQLLNVCLGGSLLQHVESGEHSSHREAPMRESRWHDVEVLPASKLADAIGAGRALVNSRHHQAVTPQTLAQGLRVTALSDDGLVEAVEGAGGWVVGVQWHPEREEAAEPGFAPASKRLFRAFASAIMSA